MRTPFLIAVLVVLVSFSGWLFLLGRVPTTEEIPVACTTEAKICPDGSAVGRTGPNCEFTPCGEEPEPATDDFIVIDSPLPGVTITSPVTVYGKARGNWFFEGSFPIVIVNWDGLIIGQGIATAQGEWMTTEFVPFVGSISYTFDPKTPYNRGTIIFKKDNPSGLPENDDAREIPILFGGTDAGMEYPIPDEPAVPPGDIACTMDAKRCPDGSFVGRVPPSCAFAPCPTLEVQ
jgi:hypothetical protein